MLASEGIRSVGEVFCQFSAGFFATHLGIHWGADSLYAPVPSISELKMSWKCNHSALIWTLFFVCVCVWYESMWNSKISLRYYSLGSKPHGFGDGISHQHLELPNYARLAGLGQWSPRILSLSSQHWNCRHAPPCSSLYMRSGGWTHILTFVRQVLHHLHLAFPVMDPSFLGLPVAFVAS